VVGCVIPASYKTGSDGDIEAFCEHMLIFGLIRVKQGGAGLFLTDIASGAGQNGCSVILGAAWETPAVMPGRCLDGVGVVPVWP